MKNLIVFHNNDRWIERFLLTFKALFNNDKSDCYSEPDLLICDEIKGAISSEKLIKMSFLNSLKPFVKNIFVLLVPKIISLNNSQSLMDLTYDNIIYFPISIGTAIANNIINEQTVKYGKKLILPSDDDIDRFYIIKTISKKDRVLIDKFIVDCGNIILLPTLTSYLPMKDRLNKLEYTIPLDFEIYSKPNLNEERNLDFLEMQVFTKPQSIQSTIDVLKEINKNQNYIKNLGLFPVLNVDKKLPLLIIKFLKEIKKSKASFVFFLRDRPLKTFWSQLETFNSLFIQRRGGFTVIKYAIIKGLLIFGDSETPNGKMLKNDYGIKIITLEDFNKGSYNKQDLANIILNNRIKLMNVIEKSKNFFYELFSSKNALENLKNN